MKTEAEIKNRIKILRKKVRNSFPCDEVYQKSKYAISVLQWVLKNKKD